MRLGGRLAHRQDQRLPEAGALPFLLPNSHPGALASPPSALFQEYLQSQVSSEPETQRSTFL